MMEETVGTVRRYLPAFAVEPECRELISGGTWCWLTLPAPAGADYLFQLHEYSDGEMQISAKLLLGGDEGYFWYRPFELAAHRFQKEQLIRDFLEAVRIVMTCQTQIVQRRGWVFWHFSCKYLEGNDWKGLGSGSVLRGRAKVPEIQGKTAVFTSPPVGQALGRNP